MGSKESESAFPPSEIHLEEFHISAYEVTVQQYCTYLNNESPEDSFRHPQIRNRSGRFAPIAKEARKPIAHVTYSQARKYCEWVARQTDLPARLPSEREWEAAARGGLVGGRYPWGWGSPEGHACYDAAESSPVGSCPPNPFGLHDMAGNIYEMCTPLYTGSTRIPIRGGSWAESDKELLRVYHRTSIRRKYKGADVGFRVVREPKENESKRRFKDEDSAGNSQQEQS